jgi:hypothetical protein
MKMYSRLNILLIDEIYEDGDSMFLRNVSINEAPKPRN